MTRAIELQETFKEVLRKIRPATLHKICDAETGAKRDYVLGRDGLLDVKDHVEKAIWQLDDKLFEHSNGWSVTLRLNTWNGGIYVETSRPHSITS